MAIARRSNSPSPLGRRIFHRSSDCKAYRLRSQSDARSDGAARGCSGVFVIGEASHAVAHTNRQGDAGGEREFALARVAGVDVDSTIRFAWAIGGASPPRRRQCSGYWCRSARSGLRPFAAAIRRRRFSAASAACPARRWRAHHRPRRGDNGAARRHEWRAAFAFLVLIAVLIVRRPASPGALA